MSSDDEVGMCVSVGGIGTVLRTNDPVEALDTYEYYIAKVRLGIGRASAPVRLIERSSGEILREWACADSLEEAVRHGLARRAVHDLMSLYLARHISRFGVPAEDTRGYISVQIPAKLLGEVLQKELPESVQGRVAAALAE